MTVKELIAKLQELDPDLPVYVTGLDGCYEGELTFITGPSELYPQINLYP